MVNTCFFELLEGLHFFCGLPRHHTHYAYRRHDSGSMGHSFYCAGLEVVVGVRLKIGLRSFAKN